MNFIFNIQKTIFQKPNESFCVDGNAWCEETDSYPEQLAQSVLADKTQNTTLPTQKHHYHQIVQRKPRHTRLFSLKGMG